MRSNVIQRMGWALGIGFGLVGLSLGVGHVNVILEAADATSSVTPAAHVYLPSLHRDPTPTPTATPTPTPTPTSTPTVTPTPTPDCPTCSDNEYSAGPASQFEEDDPVRPAETHADKNLEVRSYTLNPDPGLKRDLIDAGQGDDPMPPQLATLFRPYRVPAVSNLYQVHHWAWEESPDPGDRAEPISYPAVTALGMRTTPGEVLQVPVSGYNIGGHPVTMEVLILYADADTVALRYTREDSSGSPGYTIHVDNLCVDPNLLALYEPLDDPDGPRYVFVPPDQRPYWYDLPNLPEGHPIGVAGTEEIVVAIVDSGTFMDPRVCHDWWEIRPGYDEHCAPLQTE